MPGWAPSLLAIALILPVLVAAIDAFARARRRGEPVSPWLVWVGAGALALDPGARAGAHLGATGAVVEPPEAPVAPDLYPLDAGAVIALVAVAACHGRWPGCGLRALAARREPGGGGSHAAGRRGRDGARAGALGARPVAGQPFAALLMVPALHLWTLATLVDPGPPLRARLAMVGAGLLLPVLLGVYVLVSLSLDPISGAWYLMLLVTGGHIGVAMTLLVGRARRRARIGAGDSPQRACRGRGAGRHALGRGPASYAGPGSLGGTDSALER